MSLDNLTIGWFDFAIVLMVLIGVKLGSTRGMSKEFLTFLQWGFLVVAAGFYVWHRERRLMKMRGQVGA